jgi:hypothetical protein
MLWGIALALFGVAEVSCAPQDPAGCLRWLAQHANAKTVELANAALVGQWTEAAGLSGSELYLFEDHTFIHTEWADIMPETVSDKGRWVFVGGVLTMSPDAEVTWKTRNDRRYVALRQGRDQTDLLLGLERAFAYVSYMADEPKEISKHVRLASRTRRATWKSAESEGIKAALMKRAWRPDWHAK